MSKQRDELTAPGLPSDESASEIQLDNEAVLAYIHPSRSSRRIILKSSAPQVAFSPHFSPNL